MAELNIVLVEPEIPQNTGNIARTCACTGARLHIVKPMGFTVTDKHLKRSGLDYWQYLDLTYYENLDDFFEKHPDAACYFFTTKAVHRHSDPVYPDNSAVGLPRVAVLRRTSPVPLDRRQRPVKRKNRIVRKKLSLNF